MNVVVWIVGYSCSPNHRINEQIFLHRTELKKHKSSEDITENGSSRCSPPTYDTCLNSCWRVKNECFKCHVG